MRFLTHDNMKLHPALYIPWVASVYLRVCFHRGGAKGLDSLWGTIPGPWGRGRFPFQSLLPLSGAFVQYSPPHPFSRRSFGSRCNAATHERAGPFHVYLRNCFAGPLGMQTLPVVSFMPFPQQ